MPTTPAVIWNCKKLEPFMNPDKAKKITVKLAASLTLAAGTALGRTAATNLWGAYVDAGALDPCRALLGHDCATDAAGLHYYGAQASSEYGEGHQHAWAWISGEFAVADLVGLDAGGLADLGGRVILGDNLAETAVAVIHIG